MDALKKARDQLLEYIQTKRKDYTQQYNQLSELLADLHYRRLKVILGFTTKFWS